MSRQCMVGVMDFTHKGAPWVSPWDRPSWT